MTPPTKRLVGVAHPRLVLLLIFLGSLCLTAPATLVTGLNLGSLTIVARLAIEPDSRAVAVNTLNLASSITFFTCLHGFMRCVLLHILPIPWPQNPLEYSASCKCLPRMPPLRLLRAHLKRPNLLRS